MKDSTFTPNYLPPTDRELLAEARQRLREILNELPRDESWWTATDRRAARTLGRIEAALEKP